VEFRIKHLQTLGIYVPQTLEGAEWKTIIQHQPIGSGFGVYTQQQLIDCQIPHTLGWSTMEGARGVCEAYECWVRTGEEEGVDITYFTFPAPGAGNDWGFAARNLIYDGYCSWIKRKGDFTWEATLFTPWRKDLEALRRPLTCRVEDDDYLVTNIKFPGEKNAPIVVHFSAGSRMTNLEGFRGSRIRIYEAA